MKYLIDLIPSWSKVLSVAIVLLAVLFTSKSIAEGLAALILILAMVFYYTQPVRTTVFELTVLRDLPLAHWLQDYQRFILEHWPRFDGISVFGNRILSIHADVHFVATLWPVLLLFVGVIVRVVLGRYIRHEKLKRVGREYWLFITAYTILALMISDIIHWSFLKMMLASLVAVFIVTAGLFRVSADLLRGLWVSIKVAYRFSKIATMYLALLTARIAKVLRNLMKFIRELYEAYIIERFRRLYRSIQNFLDDTERQVRALLDAEHLDD